MHLMDAFMKLSLSVIDMQDIRKDPSKTMRLMCYEFGAVDSLCQLGGLDKDDTIVAITRFHTQLYKLKATDAAETVAEMMRMSTSPEGTSYMIIGGEAARKFVLEKDGGAPLALHSLLR